MLCLYRVVEYLLLKVILEEEYVCKIHVAVTCQGKVLLETLVARTSRMDVQSDHPLLSGGAGARALSREEGQWGGWVVLRGCCRPDLCESVQEGALPSAGYQSKSFFLLFRTAAPEMAW